MDIQSYSQRIQTFHRPTTSKLPWNQVQGRLDICGKCEFFTGKNCEPCGCGMLDHACVVINHTRECPKGFFSQIDVTQ